jgi:hypothetical protein
MKIAYLFTGGRKNRLEAIKNNESPEDFFYGALELRRRGYDITVLEESDFLTKVNKLNSILFSYIFRFVGLDYSVYSKFSNPTNINELNKFDILVATTNAYGMTLGLLKKFGKIKSKIIFLSMCPLFPEDNFIKKFVYKKVASAMFWAIENTHEIDFLNKLYGPTAPEMMFVPFGVDENFWRLNISKKSEKPYVLSMGNDSTRDFESLVSAWKPHFPDLKIITRREILAPIPSNVHVIQGDWNKQFLSDDAIRTYIQESMFVIIPTKESLRSSGPSVAMQSMGCGKMVILSRTAGCGKKKF